MADFPIMSPDDADQLERLARAVLAIASVVFVNPLHRAAGLFGGAIGELVEQGYNEERIVLMVRDWFKNFPEASVRFRRAQIREVPAPDQQSSDRYCVAHGGTAPSAALCDLCILNGYQADDALAKLRDVCSECGNLGDVFLNGELHEHSHLESCSVGKALRGGKPR